MASNPVSYELLDSYGLVNNTIGNTRNPAGNYVMLINKTGAPSIKGTIVQASSTTDNAFEIAPADSIAPMGIVYDDGIADGTACKVVYSGIAQVLLKDGLSSTHGYWCGVSDTAGRAYVTASPPGVPDHNKEVGHCLESKISGTNVLMNVMLQFN